MRCSDCKWWVEETDRGVGDGECRVSAPTPVVITSQSPLGMMQSGVMSFFPTTRGDVWCGEFVPRLTVIK